MTTPVDTPQALVPGRRAPRRAVGRLLDAAMAVFAERGYAAARVDDIAKAAGTSHGTFYLYFANKRAVFLALARRLSDDLVVLAEQIGDGRVGADVEGVREWLHAFVRVYDAHWPVVRACAAGEVDDEDVAELTAALREKFTEAVARRISADNPAVDARTASAALLALVERFLYDSVRGDDEHRTRAVDTLAMVVHTGFFGGTPSALATT